MPFRFRVPYVSFICFVSFGFNWRGSDVAALLAGEALPPGFRLATGFPRRLLERPADGGVPLSSLGLDPGQHLFFVEA